MEALYDSTVGHNGIAVGNFLEENYLEVSTRAETLSDNEILDVLNILENQLKVGGRVILFFAPFLDSATFLKFVQTVMRFERKALVIASQNTEIFDTDQMFTYVFSGEDVNKEYHNAMRVIVDTFQIESNESEYASFFED